ncbi:sec-independent protein translocase protein TatC [Streptoalloteichus tenebrarius]|uniref:Sec-independent protein translocase protein TatC n=1 Tax=Streptoalloteichus tenebrarius (strain ATCC 17920 / DSM 40477 / JCM 4838 / CBS 697.72 / NBRC 16177 / NCIMB 11028 / NRRL B-12390 / A12253. 1 / ISP 5477) TaxID=1933 RepID=A0ABT1HP94_STRSD|nr:twin-arginine translocase subunit TatC [Streptoalloteichus tenebrarius]MCP2257335.1 sec-independent protein translocase protein TatC [Streptoalloteichus tenebrarius]BFF04244.1 twin-arginine translocase subunit TatC [Streptoalloteichus tenebrarius]
MTLIEHLYELRYRLTVSFAALAVATLIGFWWFESAPIDTSFLRIPSLGELLKDPYCSVPKPPRVDVGGDSGGCQLLGTAPLDAFMLRLKVAMSAGAVLSSPFWLYQLWSFITPGLYAKERKFALTFVGFATALFATGAVLAYYVVAEGLKFLLGFGGDTVGIMLTGEKYFGFMLGMLLVFGVSFELPLLVVMLNRLGVLTYDKLKRWRRGLIFGLFVFAAVATPGQDPFSMLALALALTALFELSVQVARLHDRRKARQRLAEGWDGLSDDEASPLHHEPEPVDPPEPVVGSEPSRPATGSPPPEVGDGRRSAYTAYDDVT